MNWEILQCERNESTLGNIVENRNRRIKGHDSSSDFIITKGMDSDRDTRGLSPLGK